MAFFQKLNQRPIPQSLLMGLFCAMVGIAVGFRVWLTAIGKGYSDMPILGGISSFFVGSFLWWRLVARRATVTVKRGLFTGLLIVGVSHYFVWYLSLVCSNVSYWVFRQKVGSLDGPPIDPLNGIWTMVVMALWSLVFFGWVTLPLGAAIGAAYSWFLKRCGKVVS